MNPTSEGGSSVSLSSGNINSDTSYHDDDNEGDDMVDEEEEEEEDDAFDYDDDGDYMFENIEEEEEDHYLSMQAQFDNVDLPPGVEASFSWLKDPVPSTSVTGGASYTGAMDPQKIQEISISKGKDVASSSSTVVQEAVSGSVEKKEEVVEVESMKKFEEFKLFDIVNDYSDHHFNSAGFQGQQVINLHQFNCNLLPKLCNFTFILYTLIIMEMEIIKCYYCLKIKS